MLLTARHSKLIMKVLEKNGFVKLQIHHNRYRYYTISGESTDVRPFISHGSKDYGDYLLSRLADQMILTKKELLSFIDGKLSREEYENILRTNGIIK